MQMLSSECERVRRSKFYFLAISLHLLQLLLNFMMSCGEEKTHNILAQDVTISFSLAPSTSSS
jgi:hypothetical protein